jgi:hypothetical protein
MVEWIENQWFPRHPEKALATLWIPNYCIDSGVLERFDLALELPQGYHFVGTSPVDCPVASRVTIYDLEGQMTHRTGGHLYHFVHSESGAAEDVLVLGAHYTNEGWEMVCVAAVPAAFAPTWTAFSRECERLHSARTPAEKVIIIGGRTQSFVPTVTWDEIILPHKLKHDIMKDIQSFFNRGVDVYRELNLKPFRKLLLAGVPGTGKTMLCSALAKWAIERGYLVIYVSSAYKNRNDDYGSTFNKIQYALSVAANSSHPTLILLEELDAYLHEDEKALVLNVLDGSEAEVNEKGTLLVATTNYPEAIDERILKRPGRLDRIFIIPETREHQEAEKMLQRYLGAMWRDEHRTLVPKLVGYPGAFIREVAIYALTQFAEQEEELLSLPLLEQSFKNLKEQIDVRDDFLKRSKEIGFAHLTHSNGNGQGD